MKSNREGNAFQTTFEDTQESASTTKTTPFTKKQLECLYKLVFSKMTINLLALLPKKVITHLLPFVE